MTPTKGPTHARAGAQNLPPESHGSARPETASLRRDVAALYIDPRGPYPKLVAPELCFDEARDARTYAGPLPVVAHPPCGPWGRLRHLYTGDAKALAPLALEQVRRFGGVLEHPAESRLWSHDDVLAEHCGRFGAYIDRFGGWCTWLDQVEWGHPARKRTWIYVVGARPTRWAPFPERQPTHWVSGGRNPNRKNGRACGGIVPPGIKVCSAEQRRRTPLAFAQWLLDLAASARVPS